MSFIDKPIELQGHTHINYEEIKKERKKMGISLWDTLKGNGKNI